MQPKTVKSFLKICLNIAHADRDILKGFEKLTHEEYLLLGEIRAVVQNELSSNSNLLNKLKYKSSNT